jgi:hypothetical protein
MPWVSARPAQPANPRCIKPPLDTFATKPYRLSQTMCHTPYSVQRREPQPLFAEKRGHRHISGCFPRWAYGGFELI